MSAPRSPICCVVLAVIGGALALAAASGGQVPQPVPLLPAEEAWVHELPDLPSANGVIDPLRAYVPVTSGELIAIDRATGTRAWTRPLAAAVSPEAADGVVYVGTADAVHALDGASGETRWRAGAVTGSAGLIVRSGLLIVLTGAGDVVALRRSDGQAVWRHAVEGGAVAAAVADDDRLYAASAEAQVSALAVSDGRLLWRQAIDGAVAWLARGADRVFLGTSGNEFLALDPRTGRMRWQWTLGGTPVGAVATGDRVQMAALDNLLRAFNSGNGHQRWRQALPTRALAPPHVARDEIVVTGVDPVLATFDLVSGRPIGTYAVVPPALAQGGALIDPPADAAGVHVVLVLRDGRVIGLRPARPAA